MTVAETESSTPQPTRVALLRGINVGGAKSVPMAELTKCGRDLGWEAVSTYLRTGNLLFAAPGSDDQVAADLARALKARLGLSVDVIIRNAAQLAELVSRHPFAAGDPAREVIACADRVISAEAVARLESLAVGGEQVRVQGADIFAAFPNGQAASRLAAGLGKAVHPASATARNLNTMTKLVELLGSAAG